MMTKKNRGITWKILRCLSAFHFWCSYGLPNFQILMQFRKKENPRISVWLHDPPCTSITSQREIKCKAKRQECRWCLREECFLWPSWSTLRRLLYGNGKSRYSISSEENCPIGLQGKEYLPKKIKRQFPWDWTVSTLPKFISMSIFLICLNSWAGY